MGHHQEGTDAHELCRLLGPMSIYASCTSHFIVLTFTKTNNCKLDIDKTQVISDGESWYMGLGCPQVGGFSDHFFFGGPPPPPRGGVIGRPEFKPPYWYFAFFSDGFRIWKEHMSVSSTDIMPPALSNSPQ